jgi:hypothetical protein
MRVGESTNRDTALLRAARQDYMETRAMFLEALIAAATVELRRMWKNVVTLGTSFNRLARPQPQADDENYLRLDTILRISYRENHFYFGGLIIIIITALFTYLPTIIKKTISSD